MEFKFLTKLIERFRIDPVGSQGELASAKSDNASLDGNLFNIGGNRFYNLKSEKVFEILRDENGNKISMTEVLTKADEKKIIDESTKLES